MSHFIYTDENYWINLDYVSKVSDACGRFTEEPGIVRFYGAKGESIGTISTDSAFDVDAVVAPVVAAAAGATAIVVSAPRSPGKRPTEVFSLCVPIVAWRVDSNVAKPILIKDTNECWVFIVLPDGRLMAQSEDRTFNTLADAEAEVLRCVQWEWEHVK